MRILGLSLLATLPAFVFMGWSDGANASSDGGCYTKWTPSLATFNGCSDSPALQSGNDTRSNFLLLALDTRKAQQPTKSRAHVKYDDIDRYSPFLDWDRFHSYYIPSTQEESRREGTRCDSNKSGAAVFIGAVTAARGVSASERTALIEARQNSQVDCSGANTPVASIISANDQYKSAEAKAFARYMDGALAFYDGRFPDALSHFSEAKNGKDPWLRETATYMIARNTLNSAQVGLFDKYGDRSKTATAGGGQLKQAEDAFNAYIKRYPNGRYTASARGLLRRVYWLGGDMQKLDAEYARLLADPNQSLADIIEEIDIKYLPDASTSRSPYVVAVMDLARMRGSETYGLEGCCSKALTAQELAGQADIFRGQQSLFDFLKAAHALDVANNPQETLRLIPDAAKQSNFTNLQFSRQMLRGQALEATKDRNARGFWVEMLSGAKSENQRWLVELALAKHDEKSGQLSRVFAKGSPVTNPAIRRILLTNSADAALLRQQARATDVDKTERETALYTLLEKQLLAGEYRSYLSDVEMVLANAYRPKDGGEYDASGEGKIALGIFTGPIKSDIYPCPDIKAVATMLAAQPASAKGQLCLADFVYQNFPEDRYADNPEKDELGSTKSPLDAKPYTRMGTYQRLIANNAVRGNDKAYALNRAIRCFERSGYNHCGEQEIPEPVRKGWFQQLKRDYPNNPIATSLQYYW